MTFRNKNNNNNYNNKNKTFRNSNHVNSLQIGGGNADEPKQINIDYIYNLYEKIKKHKKIKLIENSSEESSKPLRTNLKNIKENMDLIKKYNIVDNNNIEKTKLHENLENIMKIISNRTYRNQIGLTTIISNISNNTDNIVKVKKNELFIQKNLKIDIIKKNILYENKFDDYMKNEILNINKKMYKEKRTNNSKFRSSISINNYNILQKKYDKYISFNKYFTDNNNDVITNLQKIIEKDLNSNLNKYIPKLFIKRIKKDILLNDNYKNDQDVINNKTEIAKEIHEQLKNFISDDKTELSLFNKYKELLSNKNIEIIISKIQEKKNESIQAKKIQEKNIKKYENEEDKHILIKISEILHPYETLSTSTSTTKLDNLKYTCKSISI